MKPRQRGRILLKAAELLSARAEDFGRAETLDNGKPIFEAAKIDMPAAADCPRCPPSWRPWSMPATKASPAPTALTIADCGTRMLPWVWRVLSAPMAQAPSGKWTTFSRSIAACASFGARAGGLIVTVLIAATWLLGGGAVLLLWRRRSGLFFKGAGLA